MQDAKQRAELGLIKRGAFKLFPETIVLGDENILLSRFILFL